MHTLVLVHLIVSLVSFATLLLETCAVRRSCTHLALSNERSRTHISSRHAKFRFNVNEAAKNKTKRTGECVRSSKAKLRPGNIERTLNFPSHVAIASAIQCRCRYWLRAQNTFIECRLQFYFCFRLAHVTSKYCRCCLFRLLPYISLPCYVDGERDTVVRRNKKNFEAEHAKCRSQPMQICWIVWCLANMARNVPRSFTSNADWTEANFTIIWNGTVNAMGGRVCVLCACVMCSLGDNRIHMKSTDVHRKLLTIKIITFVETRGSSAERTNNTPEKKNWMKSFPLRCFSLNYFFSDIFPLFLSLTLFFSAAAAR